MFSFSLRLSERRALLSLAIQLVYIDDEVAEVEQQRLRLLRREMSLPPDIRLDDVAIDELPHPFGDMESRRRALLELMIIAAADDRLDPREEEFITAVAQGLEIDRALKLELWALAERFSQLRREADHLFKAGRA